jgi:hypothetical protein
MAKLSKKYMMYGRPRRKLSIPSCAFCKNGNDVGQRSKCWKGLAEGIAGCFTLAAKYSDAIFNEQEVDTDFEEENEHAQIK